MLTNIEEKKLFEEKNSFLRSNLPRCHHRNSSVEMSSVIGLKKGSQENHKHTALVISHILYIVQTLTELTVYMCLSAATQW